MASAPKRDPKNDVMPQNQYKSFSEEMKKTFPDWFKDDDDTDPSTFPATRADVEEATAKINDGLLQTTDFSRATLTQIGKVLTQTAWLGWGLALTVAILIFQLIL